MNILKLLIALLVVGVLVTLLPIDPTIYRVIIIVVVLAVIVAVAKWALGGGSGPDL